MKPRFQLAALVIACTLAACGAQDDPRIVQPGAPGEESRELSPDEVASIRPPAHTDADVTFVKGMIAHHSQALVMTSLVPQRSSLEDVPLLARRMEISQRAEIDRMREWLQARGEEVPEGHEHLSGELMPGMLTEAELRALVRSDGREFDRLFLESMIRHHEGALLMVQELFASGGGVEPEVGQMAGHIDSDQSIEIARMSEMLAELAGSS